MAFCPRVGRRSPALYFLPSGSHPEVTLLASIFKKRLVAAFVITVLGVAIIAGVIFQLLANGGIIT